MAIECTIEFNGVTLPAAYIRVEHPGALDNPVIGVGFYASRVVREAGVAFGYRQYAIPESEPICMEPTIGESGEEIPGEEIGRTPGPATWFGEDALKALDVTAKVASYEYLKTLPEFAGAVDLL